MASLAVVSSKQNLKCCACRCRRHCQRCVFLEEIVVKSAKDDDNNDRLSEKKYHII